MRESTSIDPEPVAIVGIAGRFPGDASSPDRLWQLICEGRNALSEVPPDRYNIDAFYHPSAERIGTQNARGGYFIDGDVAAFDAPFFRITAQEAHAMDPNQRLALELSYEALENAGLPIETIAGSNTGCYMATALRDYAALRATDPHEYPRYEVNGSMGTAMISNRVSWFFDLKGPSISLDTACSSSLVALHMAVKSIRSGETKQALVGATNLILMPETSNHLSTLTFLSPDAKSKAFDVSANGYARGEGVSVLVVKSLTAALNDGDCIRAIIRGTSVNHDGRTPGINLPSAEAQEQLIRLAYTDACLTFEDTGYFEAHGTGTAAGDPLETEAVGRVFASTRKPDQPLYIGTVKTNIGHLEGGAGLAGLIKALFMLERGQIPSNLWFETLNPKIDLEGWGLAIPTELIDWPTNGLRRASINSFGYGGTNAHCILDDAYHYLSSRGLKGRHNTIVTLTPPLTPVVVPSPATDSDEELESSVSSDITSNASEVPSGPPQLLVLSSHEQAGIGRMAVNLQSYLSKPGYGHLGPDYLQRLAYTLSNRRSRLTWTSFTVASDIPSAVMQLERPSKPIRTPSTTPSVVFVFTGQGAQWAGMGLALMAYRTYRESLLEASLYLRSMGCEWDLHKELNGAQINEPHISQPACTVVQVALVDLLAKWGVKPGIVVGHSSGEIAAAYAQGAISRESAWRIAYQRGRVSSTIATSGEMGMVAVALSEADASTYIEQVQADRRPVVACINSPISVTLSGSNEGLTEVQNLIGSKAIHRRLVVKTAYHSLYMQKVATPYLESLANLENQKEKASSGDGDNQVAMFSSVTGQWADQDALRRPQYWVDNMVCPVKFLHALDEALSFSSTTVAPTVLIEIGPHGALKGPIQQIISAHSTLNAQDVSYTSLLTRNQNAIESCLTAAGILFQRGCPIDVFKVNSADPSAEEKPFHMVDLPPFPWNHSSRFWYETPRTRAYRQRKEPRHDLLGTLDESCSEREPVWKNYLRIAEIPWLGHCVLQGKTILPFSGVLSMVVEAMRRASDPSRRIKGYQFRDVFPGPPLVLEESEHSSIETRLAIRNWRAGSRSLTSYWKEFSLSSRNRTGAWTQHSTGLVLIKYVRGSENTGFPDEEMALAERYRREYEVVKRADSDERSVLEFYETFSQLGMQWNEAHQSLRSLHCSSLAVWGSIKARDSASFMPKNYESAYVVHPTVLEGAFQLAFACKGHSRDKIRVPKYIESIFVSSTIRQEAQFHGFGKIDEKWADGVNSTVIVSDEAFTEPLLIFEGLKTTELELEVEGKEPSITTKELTKLGAYPVWDVDVENTPVDAVKRLLQKVSDGASNPDYSTIEDIEWAAYILCKRTTNRFSMKDTNMSPHHQIYYQWMLRQIQLSESGALPCQTADWNTASHDVESQVLSRVASASLEGKMLVRILENMEGILQGSVEPWELMNGDGLLEQLYRSGLSDNKTPAVQCEMIKRISHKRPLRILEVGAGTGSATSKILGQLDPAKVARYTYTDISASFFAEAADEFEMWVKRGIMDFRVFDAEHDPEDQGLDIGAYDVVVAFQVLHATSRMDETLAHCRRLLKPDSHLIVTELTSKVGRRSAVFGVLAGWWLGEQDGRLSGPEMLEGEWDRRLRRQGFSGVDWCFRDRDDEGWSSSVMASRVVGVDTGSPETYKKVILATAESPSAEVEAILRDVSTRVLASGVRVERRKFTEVSAMDDLRTCKCIVAIEIDSPVLCQMISQEFDAVKAIILGAHSTIWVTKGGGEVDCQTPELAMITGLARSIRGELPEVRLATLDLDPSPSSSSTLKAELIHNMVRIQDSKSVLDHEFVERGGALQVVRIMADEQLSQMLSRASGDVSGGVTQHSEPVVTRQPLVQPGRPLKLELNKTGHVDGFMFRDDDSESSSPLGEGEIEIEVKAVGLDHYDMAVAMGQIWDTALGRECSGIVTRLGSGVDGLAIGDRVTSFSLGSSWYTRSVRTTQNAVHKLPDNISLEEGAGLMRSFGAVIYGLVHAARLAKGETALVVDAATATGRTAVQMARHIGVRVFAGVSTDAERQRLADDGDPGVVHVFDNTDPSYAQSVMRATGGRGVDVVLNGPTTTGEMLRQAWHCMAPFGRFIELGMKDIRSNSGLDMAPFAANASFTGVNMKCMFFSDRRLFGAVLAETMGYLDAGVIRPGPLHVLRLSGIADAFRTLQSRPQLGAGRVVVRVDAVDMVPVLGEKPTAPRVRLRQDATYMVPGGLGGLGRPLLRWMAGRGARNIVTTSRSGASVAAARQLVAELAARGTRVEVFACDIGDEAALREVLAELPARGLPPVRGVVISAMNVQDAFFETMTHADWDAAVRPKYRVAHNLHRLLPDQASTLDFFVCLSSAAAQIGSIAQGNYNAGNVYQDALCRHRRHLGLPGTSIDLGWMRDIGFVAEARVAKVPQIVRDGVRDLDEHQFLAVVEAAMAAEEESRRQPILGLATGALVQHSGADASYWFSDARFAMLAAYDTWRLSTGASAAAQLPQGSVVNTKEALAAAKTIDEATAIVLAGLTAKIAKSLMMPVGELDQSCPLTAYGVDSLVAVDVRAWALAEVQAVVLVSDILTSEPMTKLAYNIAHASKLVCIQA
ncbi:hypothetical protein V8C34DRAFT_323309 [Trichoderma compactum]